MMHRTVMSQTPSGRVTPPVWLRGTGLHRMFASGRPSRASRKCNLAVRAQSLAVTEAITTAVGRTPISWLEDQIATVPAGFEDLYTIQEELGQGTFGQVYAAVRVGTNQSVAVKKVPKQQNGHNREQQIRQEIDLLRKVQGCRNVVQLEDVLEDDTHFYLIEELCLGGDLSTLQENQGPYLSEYEASVVMEYVLQMLADMHRQGLCHGDIKPSNFALTQLYPSIHHIIDPSQPKGDLSIRAIDFGTCCAYDEGCVVDARITGTPVYMAPEIYLQCHGIEVDIWAAGVMMYELLSDRFPFWESQISQLNNLGARALHRGIQNGAILFSADPWSNISDDAQDLIKRLLDRDVSKRITAQQALLHPWFQHRGEQQQQQMTALLSDKCSLAIAA